MKKIVALYLAVIALIVTFGVWLDWDRHTESFEVSFDAAQLPQQKVVIEDDWRRAHPNVEQPYFAYYSSWGSGKITAVFVNYYK